MNIGIDISQVIYRTGVSNYTRSLVTSLLEIDKGNTYTLIGGSLRKRDDLDKFISNLSKYKNIIPRLNYLSPFMANLLWNQLHFMPIELLSGKIDIFHSSDWTQPASMAKKVTTIHDLSPITHPHLTSKKVVEAHKKRLYWVKKEVDRIIVPSESVYNDILGLGFEKERIRVVYEALPLEFNKDESESIILKRFKLKGGDYLLSIGSGERKNTKRIIQAFNKTKSKLNLSKLLIVGVPNTDLDLGNLEDVIFLNFVKQDEMYSLYKNAYCLVYPSLWEGFGLPILEAFYSDCPVVTSNLSSMKEIAQDNAILVDPHDVDSLVDGIIQVKKFRVKLVEKGKKRLKDFSWEKTAKQTLEVYRELK